MDVCVFIHVINISPIYVGDGEGECMLYPLSLCYPIFPNFMKQFFLPQNLYFMVK